MTQNRTGTEPRTEITKGATKNWGQTMGNEIMHIYFKQFLNDMELRVVRYVFSSGNIRIGIAATSTSTKKCRNPKNCKQHFGSGGRWNRPEPNFGSVRFCSVPGGSSSAKSWNRTEPRFGSGSVRFEPNFGSVLRTSNLDYAH